MATIAGFLRRYDADVTSVVHQSRLTEALFRLGWITPHRAERLATLWLTEGKESEAVVQLAAGLVDSRNVEELFARALSDQDRVLFAEDDDGLVEAGLVVAKLVAAEIIAGKTDTADGAAMLGELCWQLGYPAPLLWFEDTADAISDRGGICPDAWKQEILKEAGRLLA